ncbi:IPTL-CTERM sorting domain-containing protein [Comamonas sp. B-9]|uniref:IPTL-CTERM sorting domain-containing protein n=1 Tax=Comamonas sp. B-9 TaxID=1055192 RepID=UPI00041AA2EB|nr:IPTL-CTERM sorting domain-containing protein [Comamonas sp. B-9]
MQRLSNFFRLCMAAFLLCAGAQQAWAQKVLLLTTNVTGASAEDAYVRTAYDNLQGEFASQLADPSDLTRLSVLSTAGSISQRTFSDAPGPYDLVIVASGYSAIDSSNWTVLQDALANRWANTIVLFVDGCCEAQNGGNARRMVDTLNAGTGSAFALGRSADDLRFPLNTNSPFAANFAGLNPFTGGVISYINNVPADNALYLAHGTPSSSFPAPGTTPVNDVYGLLIPTFQSNNGLGACAFAVVDVSPFLNILHYQSWTANRGKVGPAFLHAATSETGACGLPKVSKSFDKSDIYLSGSDNSTVLTIDLSNGTRDPILSVDMTDNLPVPLVVGAGAVGNTCTGGSLSAVAGANVIRSSGVTIPPGGCSITVPLVWPNTDAGRQACVNTPLLTNTITPGTDFVSPIGQVNTPATATLTCQPAQLSIAKQVVWPANITPVDLTGSSFPVSVVCTGSDGVVAPAIDTSITLDTPKTGSVSVTPVIASGSCVVTEGARPAPPANHIWVEDPAPSVSVPMAAPPAANHALLVNTLARANTDITIITAVTGGPAAGISGSFSFSAHCGTDGSFTTAVTLSGSNAGAMAITGVPQGASCTVSEDPILPAAPAGYAWSTSLPAPVSLLTGDGGNTASFVNTLVRTAPLVPAAVPTLQQWALVVLSLMLLGAATLRRRQR